MDKLVLARTQPIQGQPVSVAVLWNEEAVGELLVPFTAWLKLKKLLEKGLEMDAREDHALQVKLTIRGAETPAKIKPYEQGSAQNPVPYRGGVSNLAAEDVEDVEDAEDLAAIAAAEARAPATNLAPAGDSTAEVTQGLIRSRRRSENE